MSTELLLVDDDPTLTRLLSAYLGREGFHVRCAADLTEARHLLAAHPIRAAIIDLVLDRENGLDLVRQLRATRPDIGVIIVSSRTTVTDRIVGLEVGADDYVSKPVDVRELGVRVRRLVDRLQATAPVAVVGGECLRFSGMLLDTLQRTLVDAEGRPVPLTGKEFELLRTLAQNPGVPVSRDQIAHMVHGRDWNSLDRAIDVMVGKVRAKLGEHGAPDLIKTVRSVGYQLATQVVREQRARC